MVIDTKYNLEQHVRHRLNGFEGFIIGIVVRSDETEYEVLPVTDNLANWRNPVWIAERYLTPIK